MISWYTYLLYLGSLHYANLVVYHCTIIKIWHLLFVPPYKKSFFWSHILVLGHVVAWANSKQNQACEVIHHTKKEIGLEVNWIMTIKQSITSTMVQRQSRDPRQNEGKTGDTFYMHCFIWYVNFLKYAKVVKKGKMFDDGWRFLTSSQNLTKMIKLVASIFDGFSY